jgi:serine/threonine protein kinase
MDGAKKPGDEPIPGYSLIEPLGRGGFGEVWKCAAPGGLAKAIKFVRSGDSIQDEGCAATQELQALELIKTARHPFLLSMERVEVIGEELVIVMELAERNLHDLLGEYQSAGRQGIPRDELLLYLRDAAEALDLLNQERGLQHLDVKPRNLFVVGRHVKVADFGLVNSLAAMQGVSPESVQLGVATPLYAAPETFLGRITLYSDQYSLAVSCCELLTGTPPFPGRTFPELALQHTAREPDLSRLAERDRPVLARALAKEPTRRFPSCLAFVQALKEGRAPPPERPLSFAGRGRLARVPTSATLCDFRPGGGSTTPAPSAPPALPLTAGTAAAEAGASLRGYRFVDCLSRMPVGEVWRARDPSGRGCIVKLVFGCHAAEEADESGALARLRALRHEALEPFEVVRDGANRIALILSERDGTLADRLKECREAGLPGVPREELLTHLRRAAAALDELFAEHRLWHLTLGPRALLLDGGQLRIADYGLADLIWVPAGLQAGSLNPRYAAPELFEGRSGPACDQYALALVYQELLTGVHGFRNLSPRQMATPRLRGRPDLALLPAPDRAVVSRALDADPGKRFATCTELITALERATPKGEGHAGRSTSVLRVTTPTVVAAQSPPSLVTPEPDPRLVQRLLLEAMGGTGVRELKGFRFRVVPGAAMEHRFAARFLPGSLPIKLEGFRRHWLGQVVSAGENAVTYLVSPPVGAWQRWRGKVPTLKLRVEHATRIDPGAPASIAIKVEPLPGGEHLLEELGPRIFDSIRQFLQAAPDRRRQERFRLGRSVRVLPVYEEGEVGEEVVAEVLDVSVSGLGLFLPCRPRSEVVLLEFGGGAGPSSVLRGRIVRADGCPDGRFLVGVALEIPPLQTPPGMP